MRYSDIVPYACVYIDASSHHFLRAARMCAGGALPRSEAECVLRDMWTTKANPNPVLPCLSVRTAFDLYLRICNFPAGSEIIMSAINIPDMKQIVHHHGLRIVALDVSIDTAGPKVEHLPHLISDKTVAIMVAHIYGKWCDMQPIIDIARTRNLRVVEDCAESFCGFRELGHPESDLTLFSFGVIKHFTAFGGAIAKVKDPSIYCDMVELYKTYTVQPHTEYLKKLLKYSLAYLVLDTQLGGKLIFYGGYLFSVDHKKYVVKMLRGFPNQLLTKIRQQPSDALLSMMVWRLKGFTTTESSKAKLKAEYLAQLLPESVTQVGANAHIRNQWLYPIIVENPDQFVKALGALGMDAYRGATQLTLVEPDVDTHRDSIESFATHYPHEAQYLIDHVVYLPVHKDVPFLELERIARLVKVALLMQNKQSSSFPSLPSKL